MADETPWAQPPTPPPPPPPPPPPLGLPPTPAPPRACRRHRLRSRRPGPTSRCRRGRSARRHPSRARFTPAPGGSSLEDLAAGGGGDRGHGGRDVVQRKHSVGHLGERQLERRGCLQASRAERIGGQPDHHSRRIAQRQLDHHSGTPHRPAHPPSTTTAGGSDSATSTTTAGGSSGSSPATLAPATVLVPATQLTGDWTSPVFTIAGGTWNIGWAFACSPAPAATPTFAVFVVDTGASPGPSPAVTSSAPSGQSVAPQTTTGSQQIDVRAPTGCRWAVKVTGSSS